MSQWSRRLFSSLLDILFPPQCASCGTLLKRRNLFCSSCWSQVHLIQSPLCPVCGRAFAQPANGGCPDEDHLCGECLRKKRPFRRARSVALYEGPIMEAIHKVKYQGDLGLVRPLTSLLIEHLPVIVPSPRGGEAGAPCREALQGEREGDDRDVIIPVPLHPSRLRQRGFNQSALLAQEMSRMLCVPVDLFSLRKIRATPPQVGLTMKERTKNVKGTFHVINGDHVKGKKVLLVDDVFTTGATISECARALRKAGATSVDVLTLARTS